MSRLLPGCPRVFVPDAATRRPQSVRGRCRATRFALALALAATLALSGGAAMSLADVGSVYFDTRGNAGAGETLFNGSFTGYSNTGLGRLVMPNLTNGSYNTAAGYGALVSDTSGNSNTAAGFQALNYNTAGLANTAVGIQALYKTTGHSNVALGSTFNGSVITGAGRRLTTGSNNVDIANPGVAGESGKIRIGTNGTHTAAFLAGVSGKSIPGPVQTVVINANGQLGTKPPSATLKHQASSQSDELSSLRRKVHRQAKEIRQLRKEVLGSR